MNKKEIDERVREQFKSMEMTLNILEEEVKKDEGEFSQPNVSFQVGRMIKIFEEMCFLTKVFEEV